MKLWQKAALAVFAFVVLAVQCTQFLSLGGSFSAALRQEYALAVSAHESLAASLVNRSAFERVRSGKLLLDAKTLRTLVEDTVSAAGDAAGITVLQGGTVVSAVGLPILGAVPGAAGLLENADALPDSEGASLLTDGADGKSVCLVIASTLHLESSPYTLLTAHDVTAVYAAREDSLNRARWIGLVLGGVTSGCLLLLMLWLLHPLKVSVRAIGEIADGNYAARAPESGSDELKTLGKSINRMTDAIREREDRLSGIAESRKRFADSMAHEMKTPLTSILGFADILRIKRTVSDAERRDFATMIVDEAKHLRGLSAKLLQLASTDSAQLELTEVPVEQLFADVQNAMLPVLARRGLRLSVSHEGAVLNVDRELFLSLLFNLIDNAAKASPDGGEIWLRQGTENGHTVLSVTDRGVGMKPDTVRRATEAFYMEDKARSRKAGGAGLGLALCDDICRRHGARLEIESEYRKGTSVRIRMDVAPPETEPRPGRKPTQTKKAPKTKHVQKMHESGHAPRTGRPGERGRGR